MSANVKWEDYNNTTKLFSLNDQKLQGKCVNVYDGDTVKIVLNLPLNNTLYRWNCRINRVDTPELRTKNLREKEFGCQVRDKLREKIMDQILTVHCLEFDKYGRLLVELFDNKGECINDWLINNNYAKEYYGGTKVKWFGDD